MYYDIIIKDVVNNGCFSVGCFWKWYVLGVKGCIVVVVGEVEVRYGFEGS